MNRGETKQQVVWKQEQRVTAVHSYLILNKELDELNHQGIGDIVIGSSEKVRGYAVYRSH